MDIPTNDEGNKKYNSNRKHKRKKNFLTKAKRYEKKGIFGRGTPISDDQYHYFIGILDSLKSDSITLDIKCCMANNTFDHVIGNETHLASNQIVSKALEFLVAFTSEEHFSRFMSALAENFRLICSDPFASHVLQKVVEVAFLRVVASEDSRNDTGEPNNKKLKTDDFEVQKYTSAQKFTKNHRQECNDFVLRVGKFLLNNMEDFVWDTFASHIMRTSIFCLSGIYTIKQSFDKNKNVKKKDLKYYTVSDEWLQLAKEFPQRLELWPQFIELPYSNLTAGFLKHIFLSLKHIDKKYLKSLGKKLLVESFLLTNKDQNGSEENITEQDCDENKNLQNDSDNEKNLPKVFQTSSSTQLLESLLALSGPKLFMKLYSNLFAGKIAFLALNRNTNFAVQQLIEKIKIKEDFEAIFDELDSHFEEILKVGHTGVILAISKTCLRLQTKQGAFVGAMQIALNTDKSTEKSTQFLKCLIKLKPYEKALEDKSDYINLHGSVIAQHILQFNKPIFLINHILNQPAVELTKIFNSQAGSFIADAFMESKFIGEKSREKLIKHMEGTYVDLAVTKFGSRVIEKLFYNANEKQRAKIVKQLSEKMNQLNGTFFGRLIFQKFRVETYKLSPAEWKSSLDKVNKVEKLFSNIVK